jgi:hypothetical protein
MNIFTRWKDKATDYIDVRLGLLKLSFVQRTSTVLGTLLISFIYLFVGLGAFIFIGIALMETFISMLDSRIGGAFLTAGLFVLLFAVLFMMRKSITSAIAGVFVRILTENDEDDEDDDKIARKVKVEGD